MTIIIIYRILFILYINKTLAKCVLVATKRLKKSEKERKKNYIENSQKKKTKQIFKKSIFSSVKKRNGEKNENNIPRKKID